MFLRFAGALVLLAGIIATGFGILGWADTDSMAASFSSTASQKNIAFESSAWATSWRLWSASLITIGVLTSVAGLAMLFRLAWGLLFLVAAAGIGALFPWALQYGGKEQFGFEAPSVGESVILAIIAIASFITYVVGRSGRR
jgi:hypothetical protein